MAQLSAPSPLSRVAAEGLGCDRPEAFAVQVRVSPPSAELWLDGQQQNVSELQLSLPSNGEVHELVVKAPGFIPQRVVFRDAPPPALLQLEALPESPLPIVLEPTIVSADENAFEQAEEEPPARPARSRRAKPPARPARIARAEQHPEGLEPGSRWEPQVQVIGGEEPDVGVMY